MFNEIEQIHQLYLDLNLDKAKCRRCIKTLSCLRRWNDEKSRLRKALGADPTPKKVSVVKVGSNLNKLKSQVNAQLNFLAKCYVTNEIYSSSMLPGNTEKVEYKIALVLASISLLSNYLITYSSIINLKYVMDHYKAHESNFRMCMDYLMLTCFGILTTVLPMQLLDIVRVAADTLANCASCYWSDASDYVSEKFDRSNQCLTSLTVYQVQSINYAAGISKLTYANVLWLVL